MGGRKWYLLLLKRASHWFPRLELQRLCQANQCGTNEFTHSHIKLSSKFACIAYLGRHSQYRSCSEHGHWYRRYDHINCSVGEYWNWVLGHRDLYEQLDSTAKWCALAATLALHGSEGRTSGGSSSSVSSHVSTRIGFVGSWRQSFRKFSGDFQKRPIAMATRAWILCLLSTRLIVVVDLLGIERTDTDPSKPFVRQSLRSEARRQLQMITMMNWQRESQP